MIRIKGVVTMQAKDKNGRESLGGVRDLVGRQRR